MRQQAAHIQDTDVETTAPYRVLLVDDNELLLSCMKRYLTSRFERVDAVCMGEEALICLQRGRYDSAVLDISLPGDADGWEVLGAIRQHSPETKVVMITGRQGCEVKHEALERGATAFLEKPFSLTRLEKVLLRMPFMHERPQRFCKRFEVVLDDCSHGLTRDLSLSGMFVESEADFECQMTVDLVLLPPGQKPINLRGRVVRTHFSRGPDDLPKDQIYGLGMELIEPPAAYASLIADLQSSA